MKKIAIIGASYLQLPAVLKAQELGYEVHCFAWEKDAVCKDYADYFYPISILEKEQILQKCKDIGINGIVTIASDVAVITVNYVASKLNLISNPDEFSLITTNKYLMREAFALHNIPSPQYRLVKKGENPNILGMKYPLIIKPTDRSGSLGVTKITSSSELHSSISKAQNVSFSTTAIIEEFVQGREVSVETLSYNGVHHILQITDKITTGAPHFVELEHHQPSNVPEEIKAKINHIVLKALDALHIKFGASHSELMVLDNGDIKVIEIGARMGGDFIGSTLVKLSTGFDFLEAVIQISMGIFKNPKIKSKAFSGVYFLCKETEYIKEIIENYTKYPEITEAEITDTELRNVKCSADRSGYFIYKSDSKFLCKKL